MAATAPARGQGRAPGAASWRRQGEPPAPPGQAAPPGPGPPRPASPAGGRGGVRGRVRRRRQAGRLPLPSLSPPPPHGPAEARCLQPSRSAAVPAQPQVPPPLEPRRRRGPPDFAPMEDYHKPDQQTLQALKDTANRLRISSIKATTAAGSG